jgi:general secretion pathway protein G
LLPGKDPHPCPSPHYGRGKKGEGASSSGEGKRERGLFQRGVRNQPEDRGLTLIELLVVIAIISILATAVMPLSRVTMVRVKESELRRSLRILRNAIDEFKKDCDAKKLNTLEGYCKADLNNYPETLERLTEPLKLAGATDKTKKYLRRIPRDPFTPLEGSDKTNNWGLRSYTDAPDSTQWGGDNVYDIYSKSETVSLEGTKYNSW